VSLALLSALLGACAQEYEAVFGDPIAAAHRRWLAEDEQECEHGDGRACSRLAGRYLDDEAVPRDPERASDYLRKACEFGDQPSCNRLIRVLTGKTPGIPPDLAKAGQLFERLCNRDDAPSCYERAMMFVNGEGERQSYEAAVPWLQKACALDSELACDTLRDLRETRLPQPRG
jgi:TPR repeat protein